MLRPCYLLLHQAPREVLRWRLLDRISLTYKEDPQLPTASSSTSTGAKLPDSDPAINKDQCILPEASTAAVQNMQWMLHVYCVTPFKEHSGRFWERCGLLPVSFSMISAWSLKKGNLSLLKLRAVVKLLVLQPKKAFATVRHSGQDRSNHCSKANSSRCE